MRGAVGTQKKPVATAGGGLHQCLAMHFAFEYWQTVVVGPNTAGENGVAVVEQMVGGDGRACEAVSLCNILRRFAGGDVLKHDLQLRKILAQRNQLGVDEHRLAVEQVNLRGGHLAVHQQGHAGALHSFERGVGLPYIGHPGVAVGGGSCRIEFERHHTDVFGSQNLIGGQIVGEVKRHQRSKRHALWNRRKNTLAIGHRLHCSGHRRAQVGHDDGTGKLGRGVRDHRLQCITVTQVHMPVVGAGQGQRVSHEVNIPEIQWGLFIRRSGAPRGLVQRFCGPCLPHDALPCQSAALGRPARPW